MRRPLSILFLLSALSSTACDPVFRTPPQADQEAKLFQPPPPGAAALYIYRDSSYAPHWPIKVTLLDRIDTELPAGTYLRVNVQPGPIDVRCVTAALPDHRRTALAAGETLYLQVRLNRGTYSPYCLLVDVAPEAAQSEIRTRTRVEPINP
jgi:hypothetical protein